MRRHGSLFIVSMRIFLGAATAYCQDSVADTLDAVVISVSPTDSTLVAGAGLSQGVYPETGGIVYLPFIYLGAEHKNRIARCLVETVEDSTCLMKIVTSTATVRPNYRIMLYNLRKPLAERFAEAPRAEPRSKPFYKRKWFWIAGGTAAAVAILAATGGSSGSKSNRGTIEVSGSLP